MCACGSFRIGVMPGGGIISLQLAERRAEGFSTGAAAAAARPLAVRDGVGDTRRDSYVSVKCTMPNRGSKVSQEWAKNGLPVGSSTLTLQATNWSRFVHVETRPLACLAGCASREICLTPPPTLCRS
jgi:hypothetical protein